MEKGNLKMITCIISITALSLMYASFLSYAGDEDLTLKPRVSTKMLTKVKMLKNPVLADENSITAGKNIYSGKGICFNCHGTTGKGDGPAGAALNPRPRNFSDPKWQKARTDGEIYWAITEGTDYGMIPFAQSLNDTERWHLVNYIRQIGKPYITSKIKE